MNEKQLASQVMTWFSIPWRLVRKELFCFEALAPAMTLGVPEMLSLVATYTDSQYQLFSSCQHRSMIVPFLVICTQSVRRVSVLPLRRVRDLQTYTSQRSIPPLQIKISSDTD